MHNHNLPFFNNGVSYQRHSGSLAYVKIVLLPKLLLHLLWPRSTTWNHWDRVSYLKASRSIKYLGAYLLAESD